MIRLEGEEVKRVRRSSIWDRHWRRMENLTQKSTIEFRAGGGTGRKCLEWCETEE